MLNRPNSKGFTLIELLVVIAIIGILSSVVLASLNSARGKGRVAAAQATTKTTQVTAIICLDEGTGTVTLPAIDDVDGTTGALVALCAGAATYPALPSGWIYCDGDTLEAQGAAGCGDDTSAQVPATSFSILAEYHSSTAADRAYIRCTANNCTAVTGGADPDGGGTWD